MAIFSLLFNLKEFYKRITPRFNYLDKDIVDLFVAGFKKVINNHEALLESDTKEQQGGRWYGNDNH